MKNSNEFYQVCIVEEEVQMTLVELSHAINAEAEHIIDWVDEGILTPEGDSPEEWLFREDSLRRAKKALNLTRDLEINTPGVAMVLELLDEISTLRNQG